MPDKKDKEFVSFADAHDDWVRKNTPGFFARLRNSKLLPPPGTSALGMALGCLWRIILITGSVIVIVGLTVSYQLSGKGFADVLAGELQEILKADEVRVPPLKWKNRVGVASSIEARGSDESFFHTLAAEGVRFHLPWTMTFKEQWHLESVSMLGFDVDLDEDLPPPPAADPGEEGRNGEGDAGEKTGAGARGAGKSVKRIDPAIAGLAIHPRLDQLEFDLLHAEEGTFRWGVAPTGAGSLEKGEMSATRAGTGFALRFTSGSLSQNWLRNLAVTELAMRIEPGAILIDECALQLGDTGKGTLRGKIATGETPQIAVQVDLTSVNLEDILPKKYTAHVTGTVDLSLRFTGSNATPEGVACEGSVNVTEALVRNIPAFESMTTIYAEPRIRRLKVTGGAVAFSTREGMIEIPKLDLLCGEFARIGAELRMEDPEEETFSGKLDFGIRPDVLARYPEITETHFPREADGFRWASTGLEGTVGQLTKEFSASLASAMREINLRKNRPKP